MKEAPGSSETSVLTRATRRNNPEDTIRHNLNFSKQFLIPNARRSSQCCFCPITETENVSVPACYTECPSFIFSIFSLFSRHSVCCGLDMRGVVSRFSIESRRWAQRYSSSERTPRVTVWGVNADHPLPALAEVKNTRSIHPLPYKSSWRDA
jgi:hypothetical protein